MAGKKKNLKNFVGEEEKKRNMKLNGRHWFFFGRYENCVKRQKDYSLQFQYPALLLVVAAFSSFFRFCIFSYFYHEYSKYCRRYVLYHK